jgi:hypothetical protein
MPVLRRLSDKLSPFLVSFTVTCVFFINLCSLIFQCGCHSLWAGAAMTCSIHAQHGRHCPWCSHGAAGQAIVMVLIGASQLAVSVLPGWSWLVRTLAASALFPVVGGIVALVFGWDVGYWT